MWWPAMMSTVILHSNEAKSTVEEPKMIRKNTVKKVTQEKCKQVPFQLQWAESLLKFA